MAAAVSPAPPVARESGLLRISPDPCIGFTPLSLGAVTNFWGSEGLPELPGTPCPNPFYPGDHLGAGVSAPDSRCFHARLGRQDMKSGWVHLGVFLCVQVCPWQ